MFNAPPRSTRIIASRLAATLAAGTLLLAGSACQLAFPGQAAPQERQQRTAASGASVPIRIGKAIRADLTGVISFTGEVQAKARVAVVPRVSGQLERLYVDVGSRVREGEPLADLGRAELEVRVLEAQAAQAAAEARLAALKGKARPEVVAQADANLRAARARLQSVVNARGSNDIAALEKRAEDARARLAQLESQPQPSAQTIAQADQAVAQSRARLNALLGDPSRQNDRAAVDQAREEVRRAEEAASAARNPGIQAALDQARRDVTQTDQALAQARFALNAFDQDQARALVEAAEAQVKLVNALASPDEIKAAESGVEQAFALAELARIRLRDATITAPIAGVVAEINSAVGSSVGPTAPILVLIPPELQVTVMADETQAAQIQTGQSVTLSIESLPQDSFSGVVKSVAPILDTRSRTVALRVEVPDPRGKLRPGMFAQLAIQTAQRQGAILVPKEAVVRQPVADGSSASQSSVFLVVENRVRRQRVLVGPSDARNVEIIEGLSEGMDVVLSPRADLVDGEIIVLAP